MIHRIVTMKNTALFTSMHMVYEEYIKCTTTAQEWYIINKIIEVIE